MPGVDTVVIGVKNRAELRECLAAEARGTLSTEERAKLVCTRGIMSYGLENVEGTERLWRQSTDLFRQTDFTSGVALSLGGLALMALARGEL